MPPEGHRPQGASAGTQPSYEVLQQAAEWFALLRGAADGGSQARWRSWLEQRSEHREAWRYVESISGRFEPLREPSARRAAVETFRAVRGNGLKRRQVLGGLAMVTAGGLAAWCAGRHARMPQLVMAWRADYRTATGEIREIPLADGSRVWLNTASALDADLQPGLRRLRLIEGEVLIQTAKDAQRPFVVDTAQGRLRALGTRFKVRLDGDATLLSVYAGAVEVRTAGSGAVRVAAAGEQLRFGGDSVSDPAPADPARQAWSQGVLLAENIPLGELVAELNRYYPGHLGVAPEVAGLRVLGGYPLRDPDKVLSMLEAVLPIRVDRTLPWWTVVAARPQR